MGARRPDDNVQSREVKFADAIDEPLLTVLVEETPVQYGVRRLLLSQYQVLDARAPDFANRLRQAMTRGVSGS